MFPNANLASQNGGDVKLQRFSSDIEVVSLAKSIRKNFLRLRQPLPFSCLSVQLTQESFRAVVLKIEELVVVALLDCCRFANLRQFCRLTLCNYDRKDEKYL